MKQVVVGSAIKGTEGSTVPKLNPYPNKPMVNVTPGGALVNLKDLRNSMVGAINRRLGSVVTGAVTKIIQ